MNKEIKRNIKINMKKVIALLFMMLLLFTSACSFVDEAIDIVLPKEEAIDSVDSPDKDGYGEDKIDENGYYTGKEEVAGYINLYGKLPGNFITKKEASNLGWEANKGNLWDVTDKKSIGGDRFGNREGRLPKSSSRQYYECDIDYEGGFRGAKRIVYSDDGLIYYTEDHYDNFTLLYGDE